MTDEQFEKILEKDFVKERLVRLTNNPEETAKALVRTEEELLQFMSSVRATFVTLEERLNHMDKNFEDLVSYNDLGY